MPAWVKEAAESAASAGPQGRTAASHWALGGAAARLARALWPGAGRGSPGSSGSKPRPAPPGRRLQLAGRTQALRHRTVLWTGRIERCKRGLRVRGRYAARRRRPICAGALVRSWAGLAVALLLLLLVLILLLGAVDIFRRGEHGIGLLWRRHLAPADGRTPMSAEATRSARTGGTAADASSAGRAPKHREVLVSPPGRMVSCRTPVHSSGTTEYIKKGEPNSYVISLS